MPRIFNKQLICAVIFAAVFNGCILTPIIQGAKDLGVTETDRQELLTKRLKQYEDAVYWGDMTEAMTYVSEEDRHEVQKEISKIRKQTMHVVESRVDNIDWAEEAKKATVTVVTKYFAVPVYIVKERTDEQEWNFDMTSGWLLKSSKTVDVADATGAG